MSSATLAARGVSRFYDGRHAVADASLDLQAGRIACLLGPSGCGKSTLLRLIAGLEPVDAGEIHIGGALMSAPGVITPPEARGVGLVFQDFALFPHLSVADNIGFGLKALPAAQRRERVAALLARFHLEALADAWPHTLSGGEQQRVAIARALVRAPSVLLLDEPFSGLDGQLRASVRQSALADLRAAGAAVLIVTHDPEEALLMADDLVLMSAGRILQTGSPEDCYLQPVSLAAARLLGEATDLPASIDKGVAHTAFGSVPAPGMADGAARVMVRSEALCFDPSGAPAEIIAVAFGGSFHSVTLSSNGSIMIVRTVAAPPPVGTKAGVSLNPMRTAVFQGA